MNNKTYKNFQELKKDYPFVKEEEAMVRFIIKDEVHIQSLDANYNLNCNNCINLNKINN